MYRSIRLLACALIALIGSTASAWATSITNTALDLATWEGSSLTVAGSQHEADFTGVTEKFTGVLFNLPAPAPETQFTVTGPDGSGSNLSVHFFPVGDGFEGGSDSNAQLVITPSAGSGTNNAFLLALRTTSDSSSFNNQPVTITLSDGETATTTGPLFGFSLTHPISSITLSTVSGSHVVLYDFFYGTSALTQDAQGNGGAQTPAAEGATLIMTVGGFFILFGAGRKLVPKTTAA
jgi:hypothetical protein